MYVCMYIYICVCVCVCVCMSVCGSVYMLFLRSKACRDCRHAPLVYIYEVVCGSVWVCLYAVLAFQGSPRLPTSTLARLKVALAMMPVKF